MNFGTYLNPKTRQRFQRTTRSLKRKEEEEDRIKKQQCPPPPLPLPVQRVKADFGHTIFPNEIWDKIFILLPKKDLCSMTLTSKSLRFLANRSLWEDPRFKPTKNGIKGEDFETLLHLPIQKLRTCDLYFKRKNDAAWFAEMFEKMPHLMELEVCSGRWATNDISINILQTIAPFVTKMTLDCIIPECDSTLTEFLEELAKIDFLKLRSVKLPSMILRGCANSMHSNCRLEKCPHRVSRYKLGDLQLINHLPITELSMNCLQPEYVIDVDGWCVFDPYNAMPFPQIPFLLEMKSLRKVVVNLYHALTDADVAYLKELRSRNGVTLDLVHCRYEETLERLRNLITIYVQ